MSQPLQYPISVTRDPATKVRVQARAEISRAVQGWFHVMREARDRELGALAGHTLDAAAPPWTSHARQR